MFSQRDYFTIIAVICVLGLIQLPTTFAKLDERIIGGTTTTIDKVPYLVQLHYYGGFLCGGTLISPRHVLTAAHCVEGKTKEGYIVTAGSGKRTQPGASSSVAKIMVPANYNKIYMDLDVAVFKLTTPLRGASIRPIALCNKPWNAGAKIKVSGWGLTDENGYALPNEVQTVDVFTIPKAKCTSMYRRVSPITNSMFCASAPANKDACSGDSGGPAIIDNQVCGIVSWGVGCGRSAFPGIYTNVNVVKQFILNSMKE